MDKESGLVKNRRTQQEVAHFLLRKLSILTISTQGPTEGKTGAMGAFWGWWAKSEGGEPS